MLLLPTVAYSAFRIDFPQLNEWEALYYYKQQIDMKDIFGIEATIKFI